MRRASRHRVRPTPAVLRALGGLVAAALCAGAAAHHSIGSVYDSAQRRTFAARVAEFQFVNPHPYVVVDADPDATGTERRYKLEMDNRHELVDIGMNAETLKPGDRVVVTGSVSKSSPTSLYLWRLERAADGMVYEQIGFDPHISYTRAR